MKTLSFFCFLLCGGFVFGENPLEEKRESHSRTISNTGPGEITIPTKIHSIDIHGIQVNESFYNPNLDVHWSFEIENGYYLSFVSEKFDLELSENCMFDFLRIVEQDDDTKFCGWGHLAYISRTGKFDVYFYSDNSYEGRGFKLKYETKPLDDIAEGHCNSFINGGANGEISDSDKTCLYRIQAPAGLYVDLDLKMINFGSRSCEEESIKIYSGVSTQGKLLKTICAGDTEGNIGLYEEKLFIEYRRNFEVQSERFRIRYSYEQDTRTTTVAPSTTPSPVGGNNDCSKMKLDQDVGFVHEFPHWVNDKHCVFVVRTKPQYVIQIFFENFDLEWDENCTFDSLKVISGEREDSTSLGGPYCGRSLITRTFLTSGNSLRLEFNTDNSFALYGVRAKIDFIQRGDCTCEDQDKVCVRTGFEKKCLKGSTCNTKECQNGGTCVKTLTSEQCYCQKGFSGETCEKKEGDIGFIPFDITPEDRVFKRGQNHLETCSVDTTYLDERPIIEWTFKGERIGSYTSRAGFGTRSDQYLQLNDIDSKMGGLYSCQVTIGDTFDEIFFTYTVRDECLAQIERGPDDTTENADGQVILTCAAYGAERVYWEKNGFEINVENTARFSYLPGSKYLQISPLEEDDAGEYTCVAVDSEGCSTTHSATLSVTKMEKQSLFCGLSIYDQAITGRVSMGKESRLGEFPWHVNMLNRDGESFCGASVVSQSFIITAAHCIKDNFNQLENVKLVFDETDINENADDPMIDAGEPKDDEGVSKTIKSENCCIYGSTDCLGQDVSQDNIRYPVEIIEHPLYDQGVKFNHDIAIIRLNKPVKYGKFIRPICLQPAAFYDIWFFEGRTKLTDAVGYVAGCGEGWMTVDNKLMDVRIPYVHKDACEEAYEGELELTDNMFCAGFEQALRGDTCSGDSGGAMIMTDDKRWYQTGIVSHGKGCDKGNYGVYTNVGVYYDWIRDITHFDTEEVENFLKNLTKH